MNRRGFLALLSALAAFPALVREKRDELDFDALDREQDDVFDRASVSESWFAMFVDEHGRFVHHAEQIPTLTPWVVLPVHWIDPAGEPRQHVYDHTRFELVEVDEASRKAIYRYHSGPRPSSAWYDGLDGEPLVKPLPLHAFELYREYRRLELQIIEHMAGSCFPRPFIQFDDTAEAVDRMEGEGVRSPASSRGPNDHRRPVARARDRRLRSTK